MPDAAAHAYPEGPWLTDDLRSSGLAGPQVPLSVLAERKPYGEAWVASGTPEDLSAWR